MKAKELRDKNVDELNSELISLERELFNLRMQKGVGQLTKSHQMRNARRDVARIKTILTEKMKQVQAS